VIRGSTPGLVDGVILIASPHGTPAYYIVRGYTHTEEHVIVEPYRELSCKRLKETLEVIYHPCLGTGVPQIPRDRIISKIPGYNQKYLSRRARRVVEELRDTLGLEEVWVTGSHAISCEEPNSDIDIIALYKPGIIKALKDLAKEGVISQCQEDRILMKRINKGPRGIALDLWKIKSSILDSCFRGTPYTLRLILYQWEQPCRDPQIPLGKIALSLKLEPASPYTVPATYRGVPLSKDPAIDEEVIVETWRTRYQELPTGFYKVKGLLRMGAKTGRLTLWPDYGGIERIA